MQCLTACALTLASGNRCNGTGAKCIHSRSMLATMSAASVRTIGRTARSIGRIAFAGTLLKITTEKANDPFCLPASQAGTYGAGMTNWYNPTIIIHTDTGLDDARPRAYVGDVRRTNQLPYFATQYAVGMLPPRYPVPALSVLTRGISRNAVITACVTDCASYRDYYEMTYYHRQL